MGCSRLATVMDQEMIEVVRGIVIAARATPHEELPRKDGSAVAAELGGRYLLRYLLPHQVGLFANGSKGQAPRHTDSVSCRRNGFLSVLAKS